MYRVAVVTLQHQSKIYDFFNPFQDLEIGEQVVVDTVNGFQIGKVVALKSQSMTATKYIVQKIDLEVHEERLEKEKRKEELRGLLRDRKKELEELQKYEQLAENDQKMAELLKEYKELNK